MPIVAETKLIGVYTLLERLAVRAWSETYHAQHSESRRQVVLRIQTPQAVLEDDFAAEFMAEKALLARFEQPYILPLLDYGVYDGLLYTVVPFVEEVMSLDDRLHTERLTYLQIEQLMAAAASALDYAHQRGVCHLGLDAASLIFDKYGNFYITHWGRPSSGALPYAAPEQWAGQGAGQATDIYSLGVLLYQMVMGKLPFEAASEAELMAKILDQAPLVPQDDPLAGVILRALAKDPAERYASAGALASAVQTALALPPEPPAQAIGQWRREMVWSSAQDMLPSSLKLQHSSPLTDCLWLPHTKAFLFADEAGCLYEGNSDSDAYHQFAQAGSRVHQLSVGGQVVVAAREDGKLSIWGADGSQMWDIEAHQGAARACSLDEQGEWLASVGADGRLTLWHLPSTLAGAAALAHQGGAWCCSLSDSGQLVVTGGEDALLQLWSVLDGRRLQTFTGHSAPVTACQLKGELILSGAADGEVRVWDIMMQDQPISLKGHRAAITACQIEMFEDLVCGISASEDGSIKFWDLRRGVELQTMLLGQAPLQGCALRDETVLSVSAAGVVRLDKHRVQSLLQGHKERVSGIALDENLIFSIGRDQNLQLLNAATGEKQLNLPLSQLPTSLAVTPHYIFVGGDQGVLYCYDRHSQRLRWEATAHQGRVTFLGVLDDKQVVTGGADGLLATWNMVNGARLSAVAIGSAGVRCGVVAHLALVGTQEGRIELWDVDKGDLAWQLGQVSTPITALAGQSDWHVIGTGSGTVYLWGEDSQPICVWQAGKAAISTVALHGNWVFVADTTGQASLWDVSQGNALKLLAWGGTPVTASAWLGEKKLLLGDEMGNLQALAFTGNG